MELNKIYNEDCIIGMQRIPDKSIDLIVTDLPYAVLNRNNPNAQWDNIIPFDKMWEQYERVIKDNGAICLFAQGMFTAQLMMSNPKLWRYNLIWDKVNRPTGFLNAKRQPMRIHEDICVFYKKQPTYNPQFTYGDVCHKRGKAGNSIGGGRNGCYGNFKQTEAIITNEKYPTSIIKMEKEFEHNKHYHPTQKSVNLISWLIKTYSNEGDLVLDSCMGSGTTAVACLRANRQFIGFELTKEYYDIAVERVNHEQNNQTLF